MLRSLINSVYAPLLRTPRKKLDIYSVLVAAATTSHAFTDLGGSVTHDSFDKRMKNYEREKFQLIRFFYSLKFGIEFLY